MISGKSNGRFKKLKKLNRKKYRDKTGLFLIETEKLIGEAIKSNVKILNIIVNEEYSLKEGEYGDIEIIRLENSLFNDLSNLVNSDGIMALCEKNKNREIRSKNIVLLDRIQDPGNVGTIIRSAEAFGFMDLLAINSCDFYNYKTLRASMGSIFRVNCMEIGIGDLKDLKSRGYGIYSLDMDGKDICEYEDKIRDGKNILVVGNEGNGLDGEILSLSDHILSISMKGQVESLNAAISVSILMNKISNLEDR